MGPAPPPPRARCTSAGGPPPRRWTATGKGSAARRLRSATSACEQPALAARPSERRPVRSGLVFALANLHDSARSPSPPPPPAHPALQSTSSPRSGRRPSSRRTRPSHRASCAPVAPIAVAPRRHRASWHRRRGPGPQRRRPATSPRNPPLEPPSLVQNGVVGLLRRPRLGCSPLPPRRAQALLARLAFGATF